ncbi:TetR/AcrR family transcriptional regulator [Sinosporangium siamense]|nr:TetR/AcrR family transcriptional regulator [Sinosporangium siamense]
MAASNPPARKSPRLTARDWAASAYEAFTEGGLDAVAVEPVAARLGATKGSFYWHFKDRAALVQAVLDLWLAQTDLVIVRMNEVGEPRARLERLFTSLTRDRSWARIETDLLGKVADPAVSAAVHAAGRRRLDFMADCLRELGLPADAAHDRALQAYALWIGLLQLTVAAPGLLPPSDQARRFGDATLALLAHLFPAGAASD